MRQSGLILILVLMAALSYGQTRPQIIEETDLSIGKSVKIRSAALGENRDLNIYLPSSYRRDSLKAYPVIYLLDGSRDEDFLHVCGIVQFGAFPWIKMVPESIVVGIGNIDRKKDFTFPSQSKLDQKEFPTSGNSARFIRFLGEEVQPFIDSTLRTKNTKTIIGQSLGGLLATEVLLKQPGLFDNYIIVSPSLWWDNESLLDVRPSAYASEKSVYIAVGKEGEVMERTARQLFDKLTAEKKEGTKLFFEFMEDKTHGDALHQAVYNAFEKIFEPGKE